MKKTGMVPLFYHHDVELAKKVLKACYEGGARLFEFTHRGNFAHIVFAEISEYCSENLPDMILGIGSLTDPSQASRYMDLGANFVVTPVLREDIAVFCNRKKVLWVAGCGSALEIAKAEELGAEIVKLFPSEIYGPRFVKALKGPQPWTNIMATGGITTNPTDLKKWFKAGVTCVGIGSSLISKELVEQQNFDELKNRVKECLKVIQEFI